MECIVCQEPIVNKIRFSNLFQMTQPVLCTNCISQLAPVNGGCPTCGKQGVNSICRDCQYWLGKNLVIPNTSLYYLNLFAEQLISRIKFNGDLRLLYAFKQHLQRIRKKYPGYFLQAVPIHQHKFENRGFNQAAVLASFLAKPQLNCVEKVADITQSKRSKYERLKASQDFRLINTDQIRNKKILIVDDIYTTGATIHHIGQLLLDGGAKEVQSLTLFRS